MLGPWGSPWVASGDCDEHSREGHGAVSRFTFHCDRQKTVLFTPIDNHIYTSEYYIIYIIIINDPNFESPVAQVLTFFKHPTDCEGQQGSLQEKAEETVNSEYPAGKPRQRPLLIPLLHWTLLNGITCILSWRR